MADKVTREVEATPKSWTPEQKAGLSLALKAEGAARKVILTKYAAEYAEALGDAREELGLPRVAVKAKARLTVEEKVAKALGLPADHPAVLAAAAASRG